MYEEHADVTEIYAEADVRRFLRTWKQLPDVFFAKKMIKWRKKTCKSSWNNQKNIVK